MYVCMDVLAWIADRPAETASVLEEPTQHLQGCEHRARCRRANRALLSMPQPQPALWIANAAVRIAPRQPGADPPPATK